jgi:hypothetical protein
VPALSCVMGGEHLKITRGFSRAQLLEVIHPVWENARVWSAVYSHRQNCVLYLRDSAWRSSMIRLRTRSSLNQELFALAKEVEEQGPPEEN